MHLAKVKTENYSPYCPICDSCGVEGCCSPMSCQQHPDGDYSHAEGENTIASGIASHVEGFNNESKGDHSTHAGNFVFQSGVAGQLKRAWAWPVAQVLSIMGLVGDKTMRISDDGAMQITVDSGLSVYNYILPAQSK